MKNFIETFVKVAIAIPTVILGLLFMLFGYAFILAFPVKWLWNWVMVDVFHMAVITYWQALGLFVLSGLLLKNHTITKEKNKD